MNSIAMGILIFTAVMLLFGALFGRMRGRNRAILRLCLIVLSVILAIALRGVIVDTILGINAGDGTLKETLSSALGEELPASLQNLVLALVEIIIGLVAFFVLFIVLQFLSWLFVFPILKIFVKKGENKRKGVGALVGLAQGLVIAFVICAPLTGILVQIEKIASIEMDGKKLIDLPEETGISEFVSSAPGKVYSATGGWFFNIVTSAKDEEGNKVSIDDTCDVVVTVVGIADTMTKLTDKMEILGSESATPQQRVDALKDLGDSLIEVGESIDDLSGDAKTLVNGLIGAVKDMIQDQGGEEIPAELEQFLNDFKVQDLKIASAGKAMKGIASYIEKTEDEFDNDEPVTQEDVNNIVNGLADNQFILDLIAGATDDDDVTSLVDVEDEYKDEFETAIEASSLSTDNKALMRRMFGLQG